MKYIPLTQDKKALVDNKDYQRVVQFKWYYHHTGYAVRNLTLPDGRRKMVFLHRFVLNTPEGQYTDHINRDKLNCTRSNLRLTDYRHNNINKPLLKSNKSGFVGVCWRNDQKKWRAYIGSRKTRINLGSFINKIDAAKAYNAKAKEIYGEFATLNPVE